MKLLITSHLIGKVSNVEAFEPDTPKEVSIGDLIHQAAQLNDTLAVETIIESCRQATRLLRSESDIRYGRCGIAYW